MAVANEVNDEQDFVLTQVFKHCEELRAKMYLDSVPTNQELAKKYAISLRTVTNWRKEGCPFKEGQRAVLDWLALRRYAPSRANAKFAKQLRERRERTKWAEIMGKIHQGVAEMRQMKAAYQAQSLEVPKDLRGFRAKW